MRMNLNFYRGTTVSKPAEPDYYLDVIICSDEALDKVIEARREAFREEWAEYESKFYS